jgi:hypothetical protein
MKRIFKGPQRICLKAKIKGLSAEAIILRKKHKTASKEDKFHFYNLKQYIKRDVRHHNLAYAYLRGIPYNALERSCNEKPNPDLILKIVMVHDVWCNFAYWQEHLKKINNWLNGTVVEECNKIVSKSL